MCYNTSVIRLFYATDRYKLGAFLLTCAVNLQKLSDQIRFKLIDTFVSYKPFQLHGYINYSYVSSSLFFV